MMKKIIPGRGRYISLFIKSVVALIAIGIIPLLIMGLSIYNAYLESIKEIILSNMYRTTRTIGKNIEDILDEMEENTKYLYSYEFGDRGYLYQLMEDSSVTENKKSRMITDALRNILYMDQHIDHVFFVAGEDTVYSAMRLPENVVNGAGIQKWHKKYFSSDSKAMRLIPTHISDYYMGSKKEDFSVSRNIMNTKTVQSAEEEILGTLYIDISTDYLYDIINETKLEEGSQVYIYEMTVRAYLTHADDLTGAGIETPETWEDLIAQEGYHDKTGKYLTELACTGVRSAQELIVYLAQYDLEIASAQEDGKYKNTWKDNPEEMEKATKVFQMYKDLIDKGIVDPNCKNWGWEETDENFATGISSSYVSGNWLAEREESNPDTMGDVEVSPIPYPSDGHEATYMECKPLFILKDSKNKDGAFELATAFCSKEWQEAGFADRSPRSDVSTDTKWSKDFQALSDTGVTFPPVTLGGITQAMQDAIAKVLQEGESPEAAAEWLSDAVNASLSDSGELSE